MVDWTPVLIALAAGLPATIAAVAALIANLRTAAKVEEVRHATNSMKDELVRVTGESEKAKGKLEERLEAEDRRRGEING